MSLEAREMQVVETKLKNVLLFKRLKWKPVGQIITYHHEPHQLMEAKLD